ncbi:MULTISPECIES: hypothetical protein [Microbacterium]|uniref:hypothetical protein n=1 Tax=Microbacterium TaxID=33882 RepID=UPI000629B94B|nr:hypothetical protein [Microbacterium sp. Ag1]KKX99250.1 hypothetical protein AAY78_02395 [Microbacterium sp. Ag1]
MPEQGQEQGRAVSALRELETVAAIAELVGISAADVIRLSELAPTPRRRRELATSGRPLSTQATKTNAPTTCGQSTSSRTSRREPR